MVEQSPAPMLRIFGADPYVDDRQRGHANLAVWIMGLPDCQLPARGKIVLEAIAHSCFNGSRSCRVENKTLARKTGLKLSAVKVWVIRLVELGFIARSKAKDHPGQGWQTTLLFDPLGLTDTRPKNQPTPAAPAADPGCPSSRHLISYLKLL